MLHERLLNRYNFIVDWGGNIQTGFTEITGLSMEIEPISIRNGDFKEDIEIRIPGLLKFSEVTFKRGIMKNNKDFFDWINTKAFGNVERRNITITLMDERREPMVVWRLRNCFPTKYIGPTLMANNSNVALESLVVVHEGIDMEVIGN